jgi:hypothetical protein
MSDTFKAFCCKYLLFVLRRPSHPNNSAIMNPLSCGIIHPWLNLLKGNQMKHCVKIYWFFMAFTLLALSACGSGGVTAMPTVDTAPIFTQIASTAVALQTQVALAAVPPVSNTPEASPTPEATNTPVLTDTPLPSSTPTATQIVVHPAPTSAGALTPAGPIPSMSVTLITNDLDTSSATIFAGRSLIVRAQVKNNSDIPLQVVANLTVPDGWDVDQNVYSDCPTSDSLDQNDTCTISWYFTPQGSGQVYLRVYVRGIYTDSAGNTQRITQSPAFLFNVEPAKS